MEWHGKAPLDQFKVSWRSLTSFVIKTIKETNLGREWTEIKAICAENSTKLVNNSSKSHLIPIRALIQLVQLASSRTSRRSGEKMRRAEGREGPIGSESRSAFHRRRRQRSVALANPVADQPKWASNPGAAKPDASSYRGPPGWGAHTRRKCMKNSVWSTRAKWQG